MPGFTKKLKKYLKDGGSYFHRQGKGDHEIWYSPLTNTCFPVDGNIKSRHTANKTLSDAGLSKKF